MTTSEYLINATFVLVVLRQARERLLDLRSFLVSLAIVFFVARQYVHSLPTGGDDLVLIGMLTAVGLTLAFCAGSRPTSSPAVKASPWPAWGGLQASCWWPESARGWCSRSRSVTAPSRQSATSASPTQIGAAAWPVALVSMAMCEVVARLVIVQLRGRRLTQTPAADRLVSPPDPPTIIDHSRPQRPEAGHLGECE